MPEGVSTSPHRLNEGFGLSFFLPDGFGCRVSEGKKLGEVYLKSEGYVGNIDWKRARKFKASEEKYAPGTVLNNGRTVDAAPRDSLAKRAAKAEERWLRNSGLDPVTLEKPSRHPPKRRPARI